MVIARVIYAIRKSRAFQTLFHRLHAGKGQTRPGVMIWHWREALIAGFIAAGILTVMLVLGDALYALGGALSICSGMLLAFGLQRANLRVARRRDQHIPDAQKPAQTHQGQAVDLTVPGMGVVHADGTHIFYYGPAGAGMLELKKLRQIVLERKANAAHWQFECSYGHRLEIPVGAHGGEALFAAFVRLPQFDTRHMLSELRTRDAGRVVIWNAAGARPKDVPLH